MSFFASGFFHESPPPKFLKILKIREDVRKSMCTTGIKNTGASTTDVVDTGGKFATGVDDTGGKFATGVIDTSGK
jgi:hypothetical protein